MKSAAPQPGSVIRYAYLWAREHARGKEEGVKDRPSVVVAVVVQNEQGKRQVLVVPVTHQRPLKPADAIAIPHNVKKSLGLDDAASWIVTTEANAFIWPGPDLRIVSNTTPFYGRIPDALLQQVARSIVANRKRDRLLIVGRSE